MIVIDMDMPKSCRDCSFRSGALCTLITEYVGGCADMDIKNVLCPIKCDIEDIRAEIEQNAYPIVHGVNNHEKGMTLYGILQIIDKYKAQTE